jgi:hypothetical protein
MLEPAGTIGMGVERPGEILPVPGPIRCDYATPAALAFAPWGWEHLRFLSVADNNIKRAIRACSTPR